MPRSLASTSSGRFDRPPARHRHGDDRPRPRRRRPHTRRRRRHGHGRGGPQRRSLRHDRSGAAQRGLDTASSVSRQVVVTGGPLSPLPSRRSVSNHFEVVSVPGARAIALALGGSRNDLLVAAAAAGLGAYQERLGLPASELRLALPAGRSRDGAPGGNWFTPIRVTVPAGGDHPGPLFGIVSERLARARREPAVPLTGSLAAAVSRLPSRVLVPALVSPGPVGRLRRHGVPGLRADGRCAVATSRRTTRSVPGSAPRERDRLRQRRPSRHRHDPRSDRHRGSGSARGVPQERVPSFAPKPEPAGTRDSAPGAPPAAMPGGSAAVALPTPARRAHLDHRRRRHRRPAVGGQRGGAGRRRLARRAGDRRSGRHPVDRRPDRHPVRARQGRRAVPRRADRPRRAARAGRPGRADRADRHRHDHRPRRACRG